MLELVIRVAAAWRLTRLVVDDEITRPLREKVEEVAGPDSKWTYLVNCPYCVSVWAGLVAVVLPRPIASGLAASAGTLGVKWVATATESAIRTRSGLPQHK